jgi:hypothetical protein
VFALQFTPRRQLDQTNCLNSERARKSGLVLRVSDGIRTRDRRDHNPELYQLSYAHQADPI